MNKEVYRRLQAEAMMGQDGVVIEQPAGQFAVESSQIIEQFILMVVDKLLLDGAVEAFDMGSVLCLQ